MGKRSTKSTKSGKFMNPTDQARKEARRRELKKNKKQRLLVRTAVIKGKNPTEIILELEKLDDMEFNVLAPPPLNDKVMKDKRRKLMETWTRVNKLYEKEEPDQHGDLRKMWINYLKRKEEVVDHYEAVKTAQMVDIEEIPLPSLPDGGDGKAGDIPLPPSLLGPKVGILKKSSVMDSLRPKTCPGVPAGPPPSLKEYIEESIETEEPLRLLNKKKIRFANEEEEETSEDPFTFKDKESPKVDNVQKKMLAMSGQDVDAYMKEMEEVHKKTEAEKAADLRTRMARLESEQPQPPGEFPMIPNPGYMMRPPLRPGMPPPGVRLPPGPPPGRPNQLPPGPPPGRPPFLPPTQRAPVRQPPPGMPSSMPRMPRALNPQQSVVSAGPQLNAPGSSLPAKSVKTGSVIEAKPQMRNLLSDVTRFVPTNVKVKRDGTMPSGGGQFNKKKQSDPMKEVFAKHSQPQQNQPNAPSKDDAYAQFMAEMNQM